MCWMIDLGVAYIIICLVLSSLFSESNKHMLLAISYLVLTLMLSTILITFGLTYNVEDAYRHHMEKKVETEEGVE